MSVEDGCERGECWGLGSGTAGCPERDSGSQEAQGSKTSAAGGSGPVGVRHARRGQEPVRHRQWGRGHPQLAQSLGFNREQTPCVATLHHVFRRLDVDAFELALGRSAQDCLGEGEATIAMDGKALRGLHGRELPRVRLVVAYAGESGLILGLKGGSGVMARRVNCGWPPAYWPNWN